MLKPLTFEGRFECGLDAIVNNKIWAFVAVVGEHYGARLGIAIANEQGYNPVPEYWAHADRLDEMQDHANQLNAAEGKSEFLCVEIVCSTMGGRRYVPPQDPEGEDPPHWIKDPAERARRMQEAIDNGAAPCDGGPSPSDVR